MKLAGKRISDLKREKDMLDEETLNSRVLVTEYFHQYAAGIGGANYDLHIYVNNNGKGFPYDAAAYKAAKDAGIKPYSKKGKDEGYGEVGAKTLTRKAVTVRDLLENDKHVGPMKTLYDCATIETLGPEPEKNDTYDDERMKEEMRKLNESYAMISEQETAIELEIS